MIKKKESTILNKQFVRTSYCFEHAKLLFVLAWKLLSEISVVINHRQFTFSAHCLRWENYRRESSSQIQWIQSLIPIISMWRKELVISTVASIEFRIHINSKSIQKWMSEKEYIMFLLDVAIILKPVLGVTWKLTP